ncbi:MAG TPA: hypothetical protein P5563_04770 [Saprospiraceae bacterium]|nr:hypothetical protein [Saprospiraceae bacterium]
MVLQVRPVSATGACRDHPGIPTINDNPEGDPWRAGTHVSSDAYT